MEYQYKNVIISDLATTAIRIGKAVGVNPIGLSDSENTTTVLFASGLDSTQKTALDAFMTGSNLDLVPVNTGKTTYEFSDITESLKSITGLSFDIYPTKTGCIIQFSKSLTNSEKNSFRNAISSLLKEI